MFYILKSQVERQCYGVVTFSTINSLFIWKKEDILLCLKQLTVIPLGRAMLGRQERVEALSLLSFSLKSVTFKVQGRPQGH